MAGKAKKTPIVREIIEKNPAAPEGSIRKMLLAEHGMTVSSSLISRVRQMIRQDRKSTFTAKPDMSACRGDGFGDVGSYELREMKEFAEAHGGLDRVRMLADTLDALT